MSNISITSKLLRQGYRAINFAKQLLICITVILFFLINITVISRHFCDKDYHNQTSMVT